jgi:chitin synthase
MDYRGDHRPPRSTRPQSTSRSPAPTYPDNPAHQTRPPFVHPNASRGNVSFQNTERGDRQGPLDPNRPRTMPYAYQANLTNPGDVENAEYSNPARVGRQKSLVRPEREKIDPGHRQWHYRNHVAQLEEEGQGRLGVMPSSSYPNYSPSLRS